MNKIFAIVTSSILIVSVLVSVLVWVIVSRRWPSSAIEDLHNYLEAFYNTIPHINLNANDKGCIINYITSVPFRKFNNMKYNQRTKLIERALNHCIFIIPLINKLVYNA